MAILSKEQLPAVCKFNAQVSEQIKMHVQSQLGHPLVLVELQETQYEQILRSAGDFIAQYFAREEKYAYFMTQPLQAEYKLPQDSYWIQNVVWDPVVTRIQDIFSAESFLFNIGNVTGIQNLLVDYHLLQAYRKFSQRILSTEGQWEFGVESGTIRLFPVPKGSFPVVVRYLPTINEFKAPSSRKIFYDYILAQLKIALGHARRKLGNIPTPDGSSLQSDGDALIKEGEEGIKKTEQDAILLSEPLPIILW